MVRKKQIRKPVQSWLLFSPWFHETNKLEKLWDNWSNDITWRKQQELAGQTMQSNKAVLKNYQKTASSCPVAQSNGYCPQGFIVRESHERNYFRSGQFMHFMSLKWKSTYNQGTKLLRVSGKSMFLPVCNERLNIFNIAMF